MPGATCEPLERWVAVQLMEPSVAPPISDTFNVGRFRYSVLNMKSVTPLGGLVVHVDFASSYEVLC